jgi:gamma-glutamyltranspeptidase / glutathione hydrolase
VSSDVLVTGALQGIGRAAALRGRPWGGLGVLLAAALAAPSTALAEPGGLGVPGVRAGVVATSEPAAARAGAEILRGGGNAIDAAGAVMFALGVVEPQSAGIGGGGFMLVSLAASGETFVVDSRESAPAAATADMLDGHDFGSASTSGLSVGVPGAVRGVELALERWGTLDLAAVLEPAVRLAEEGFRVSRRLASSIESARLGHEVGHPAYDEARRVFRPHGIGLAENQRLRQPDLARTLRLLAQRGAAAFYTGPLAEAIVATQRHHRHGDVRLAGRMTLADLDAYRARVRAPVEGRYRGLRVVSAPPPSSGGLAVLQVLGMLERFPLGDATAGFGFGSARTLHVMLEAMRLAFADRAVWSGDDDFVPVPAAGLLDPAYLARRSGLIDPDRRLPRAKADDPRPYGRTGAAAPMRLSATPAMPAEGGGTTHFSVSDRHGNLVSYTNTIESAWGTGLMVPGYGFLLNNELTDFNFTPRHHPDPQAFDPGANDVAPGKRPRSSMAPTIVLGGSQPVAALGSPGGAIIINAVVNVVLALVDHGFDVQAAVDAARISQVSADGPARWEAGLDEEVIDALRALGHSVEEDPAILGAVQVVVVDSRDGRQYGAADRRRIGAVSTLHRGDLDFPSTGHRAPVSAVAPEGEAAAIPALSRAGGP